MVIVKSPSIGRVGPLCRALTASGLRVSPIRKNISDDTGNRPALDLRDMLDQLGHIRINPRRQPLTTLAIRFAQHANQSPLLPKQTTAALSPQRTTKQSLAERDAVRLTRSRVDTAHAT
jgi:hypothetical protein